MRAGPRTRTCWTPGSPPACGRSPRWAGRSRPTRCSAFYPTSVLVTGYDILFFWVVRMMMFGLYATRDDAGSRSAVSHRRAARPGPRPVRQEDVEVAGQHRRSTAVDRGLRRRRGAAHPRPRRPTRGRPGDRHRVGRRLGEVLLEAVQRHQVRAAQRGDGGPSRAERADAGRPLDPRPAGRGHRADHRSARDFQFGKAAEGLYHFAWDEVCDWYVELAKVQIAEAGGAERGRRPPGRCSAPSWMACSGCCTRSSRSSPKRCGRP